MTNTWLDLAEFGLASPNSVPGFTKCSFCGAGSQEQGQQCRGHSQRRSVGGGARCQIVRPERLGISSADLARVRARSTALFSLRLGPPVTSCRGLTRAPSGSSVSAEGRVFRSRPFQVRTLRRRTLRRACHRRRPHRRLRSSCSSRSVARRWRVAMRLGGLLRSSSRACAFIADARAMRDVPRGQRFCHFGVVASACALQARVVHVAAQPHALSQDCHCAPGRPERRSRAQPACARRGSGSLDAHRN